MSSKAAKKEMKSKPKENLPTTQPTSSSVSSSSKLTPKSKKVSKPISRSVKAGIIFPVSRVERLLRQGRYSKKIQCDAPVYLAAVLEYLVLEILELSLNICIQNKKMRITPQFINWSINNDLELNQLFKHVTIASGGVFPQTYAYPPSRVKKSKSSPSTSNETVKKKEDAQDSNSIDIPMSSQSSDEL